MWKTFCKFMESKWNSLLHSTDWTLHVIFCCTGYGYGSYTKATHPGSGGGGTAGGSGGSTIEIHVGHETTSRWTPG